MEHIKCPHGVCGGVLMLKSYEEGEYLQCTLCSAEFPLKKYYPKLKAPSKVKGADGRMLKTTATIQISGPNRGVRPK